MPLECQRRLATTASIVQLSSSSNREVQQPTSVKHPRIVDFDFASLDSISRPISRSFSGSKEIKTPKRLNEHAATNETSAEFVQGGLRPPQKQPDQTKRLPTPFMNLHLLQLLILIRLGASTLEPAVKTHGTHHQPFPFDEIRKVRLGESKSEPAVKMRGKPRNGMGYIKIAASSLIAPAIAPAHFGISSTNGVSSSHILWPRNGIGCIKFASFGSYEHGIGCIESLRFQFQILFALISAVIYPSNSVFE